MGNVRERKKRDRDRDRVLCVCVCVNEMSFLFFPFLKMKKRCVIYFGKNSWLFFSSLCRFTKARFPELSFCFSFHNLKKSD